MATKLIRIILLAGVLISGKVRRAGETLDVSESLARGLLLRRRARLADAGDVKPVKTQAGQALVAQHDLAELAKAPRAELLKVLDDLGVKAAPGTSKADLLEQIADVLAKAE